MIRPHRGREDDPLEQFMRQRSSGRKSKAKHRARLFEPDTEVRWSYGAGILAAVLAFAIAAMTVIEFLSKDLQLPVIAALALVCIAIAVMLVAYQRRLFWRRYKEMERTRASSWFSTFEP